MIRAQIQKNGYLKITADNEGRRNLKEAALWLCDEAIAEELRDQFHFLRPEWIGALTDAPILTNELIGEDFSMDDPPEHVGDTWWFPNYQITDPWEELKNTGRVIFDPEENNKSLPRKEVADPEIKPKYFFECGGCDQYHPLGFTGDCRDDANRYNLDDEDNMVNAAGEGVRLYLYEIVDEDFQETA